MRRRLLLGASLGWGLGPAAAASARDWEQHAALKHGAPATSRVRASEDFVVCFDYRTRNPAWVVERLTAATLGAAAGGGRAGESFREAADVPARLRSRLARYPAWKSNLQPDFNVRLCDKFDTGSSVVLRELDESDRFIQQSAETTSI